MCSVLSWICCFLPAITYFVSLQGTMLSTELLLNQSQPEMVALLNKRGGAFGRLIQGPPPATATAVTGGLDKERQKGKRGPQKTKTELKKKPGRAKGGWKLHGSTSKGGASSGGSRSFFCSNPGQPIFHFCLFCYEQMGKFICHDILPSIGPKYFSGTVYYGFLS